MRITIVCFLWSFCCFSSSVDAVTTLTDLPDAAVVSAAESAFELYPGVVVDPDGEAVYLMSPEGGIEMVSLTTGEVIWRTTEAAKPLALYGDLLIAQTDGSDGVAAGVLEIVLLDTLADGQRRADLLIDLPPNVWAGVDKGLGYSFLVSAEVNLGEPLVTWKLTKTTIRGVKSGTAEPKQQIQRAGYRADFSTGRAVALDGSASVTATPALPANVAAWENSNDASIPLVWTEDGLLATTQERRQGGPKSITLKRWDASSGAALPDVKLFTGAHILQFVSSDGHNLLVAARTQPGDFNQYEWSVFSLETGEKSGQINHHRSHAWFDVSGDILLYVEQPFGHRPGQEWVEEPLQVKAVLLGSGDMLWARPLRDTTYTGPYPP